MALPQLPGITGAEKQEAIDDAATIERLLLHEISESSAKEIGDLAFKMTINTRLDFLALLLRRLK